MENKSKLVEEGTVNIGEYVGTMVWKNLKRKCLTVLTDEDSIRTVIELVLTKFIESMKTEDDLNETLRLGENLWQELKD